MLQEDRQQLEELAAKWDAEARSIVEQLRVSLARHISPGNWVAVSEPSPQALSAIAAKPLMQCARELRKLLESFKTEG